jgi:hypothetical protein
MALQVDLAMTHFGIPVPAAYARIVTISGDDTMITVQVGFYASETARIEGRTPVDFRTYQLVSPDYNQDKGVKQVLYAFLKTQADFATAIDV